MNGLLRSWNMYCSKCARQMTVCVLSLAQTQLRKTTGNVTPPKWTAWNTFLILFTLLHLADIKNFTYILQMCVYGKF